MRGTFPLLNAFTQAAIQGGKQGYDVLTLVVMHRALVEQIQDGFQGTMHFAQIVKQGGIVGCL